MPVDLYYTQKVRGFQQKHVEYFQEKAVYELKRTVHRCPKCGSKDVFAERMRERSIRGVPMGVPGSLSAAYDASDLLSPLPQPQHGAHPVSIASEGEADEILRADDP